MLVYGSCLLVIFVLWLKIAYKITFCFPYLYHTWKKRQRSCGKLVSPYSFSSSSSSLSPNIYCPRQTCKDSRSLLIFKTQCVWTTWRAQGKVLGWCPFHLVTSVSQTFKPSIKLSITGHISNTSPHHCVLQSYKSSMKPSIIGDITNAPVQHLVCGSLKASIEPFIKGSSHTVIKFGFTLITKPPSNNKWKTT